MRSAVTGIGAEPIRAGARNRRALARGTRSRPAQIRPQQGALSTARRRSMRAVAHSVDRSAENAGPPRTSRQNGANPRDPAPATAKGADRDSHGCRHRSRPTRAIRRRASRRPMQAWVTRDRADGRGGRKRPTETTSGRANPRVRLRADGIAAGAVLKRPRFHGAPTSLRACESREAARATATAPVPRRQRRSADGAIENAVTGVSVNSRGPRRFTRRRRKLAYGCFLRTLHHSCQNRPRQVSGRESVGC